MEIKSMSFDTEKNELYINGYRIIGFPVLLEVISNFEKPGRFIFNRNEAGKGNGLPTIVLDVMPVVHHLENAKD